MNRRRFLGALSASLLAAPLTAEGQQPDDQFRYAASYIDKLFKNARPGDLRVEHATRFIVNLKTARALGLTIPQTLLLPADQIIE